MPQLRWMVSCEAIQDFCRPMTHSPARSSILMCAGAEHITPRRDAGPDANSGKNAPSPAGTDHHSQRHRNIKLLSTATRFRCLSGGFWRGDLTAELAEN